MIKFRTYILPILAMCVAVTLSNILVQYPVNFYGLSNILTYGAFTYPISFLVNDLTNRRYGPRTARFVVYNGFICALIVSWWLASPRIAIAAGTAFLLGQLCDIVVFTPLRAKTWWRAPLAAAIAGSIIDTVIFFSIAFAPSFAFIDYITNMSDSSNYEWSKSFVIFMPVWASLAVGDFCIKMLMALAMLLPYGAFLYIFAPKMYKPISNIIKG